MTPAELILAVFINFLTGCVQEICSRIDQRRASNEASDEEWRRRSSALKELLTLKLSEAARKLMLTETEVGALRELIGDQLTASVIAESLVDNSLSAADLRKLLQTRIISLEEHPELAKKIAETLSNAFDALVASEPELATMVKLREGRRHSEQLQNIGAAIGQVGENVRAELLEIKEQENRVKERDAAHELHMDKRLDEVCQLILSRTSPSITPVAPPTDLKEEHRKRYERCKHEFEHGSMIEAGKRFMELVQDLEPNKLGDERELYSRCLANVGTSALYQGKEKEAIKCFEECYDLMPDYVRFRANKTLALLLQKKDSEAEEFIRKLIDSGERDADIVRHLASIHENRGDYDGALDVLDIYSAESADIYVHRAIILNRLKRYAEGKIAATQALKLEPEMDSALAVLADSLAMPIAFRQRDEPFPPAAIDGEERNRIREAVRLGKRATDLMRRSGRPIALANTLINLSAYTAILGDYSGGITAANEALDLLPDQSAPLQNRFLCEISLNRYDDARKTAQLLRPLGDPVSAILREMEALTLLREPKAVLNLLETEIKAYPALDHEPRAHCLKAKALVCLFEIDQSLSCLRDAERRFPQSELVAIDLADVLEEQGKIADAERSLRRALEIKSGKFRQIAHEALGVFYLRHNRWREAAEHLLGAISDPLESPHFIRYLICLHNLKRFSECLTLCKKAISNQMQDEALYEMAVNCYVAFHDLVPATQLLEKLVARSDKLAHWLKLFELTFRLYNRPQARKVLERAYARHPKSIEVLVNYSGFLFSDGSYQHAFKLAREAVDLFPQRIEAHQSLVRVGLFAESKVKMTDEDIKAVQNSLSFLTGTAGSGVHAVAMDPDFTTLRRMLKKTAEAAETAEKMIAEHGLPMALLCKAVGRSPFQIWDGLRAHHRLGVRMAQGSLEEQNREREEAWKATAVAVEITALFSLQLLGLLSLLPAMYDQVIVPVAVFESVREELDRLSLQDGPVTVVSAADGKNMHVTEIPVQTIQGQKDFLTSILEFLKSDRVKLVGLPPSIGENLEFKKECEVLLNAFAHPTGIAQANGLSLYSDDVAIRILAKNSHRVSSGFCTQAFLRAAVAKKLLSESEYEEAIILLLQNNYGFVSESCSTIVYLLHKEAYQITPLVRLMVSRVVDPNVNPLNSGRILGTACADIWLHSSPCSQPNRQEWMREIATHLSSATDFQLAVRGFLVGLSVSLLRFPEAFFGAVRAIEVEDMFYGNQLYLWDSGLKGVEKALSIDVDKLYYSDAEAVVASWRKHANTANLLRAISRLSIPVQRRPDLPQDPRHN